MNKKEKDMFAQGAIGDYWCDVDDECPETRQLSDEEKRRRYGTQFGWGGPGWKTGLSPNMFYAWDGTRDWVYVYTEADGWQPV